MINALRTQRGIRDEPLRFPRFTDIDKAVQRLRSAIERNERIGIFGDYDCDGVTACAQLIRALERRGCHPIVRLPHRVRDGYGLQEKHVQAFAAAHVTLLITADTGITAVETVNRAQADGMDVIILDHHVLPRTLPNAYAMVHPALSDDATAPLCAAGVTFAFLTVFEEGGWDGFREDLALAAIGTVADAVPLLGCNRALVREGLMTLEQLRDCPIAELTADIRTQGQKLSADDIGFRIAPRINAAGRMDDPMIALEAVLRGGTAIERLHALNVERQEQVKGFLDGCIASANAEQAPCICIAQEGLPHGIIGLIAGKITEATGKPSLVATVNGMNATASLRSPACCDISAALRECERHLTTYGGHKQAAGCTFPTASFAALRSALCDAISGQVPAHSLRPELFIDGEIPANLLDVRLYEGLASLEPFGQGNPEPRLLLRNVTLSALRRVGAEARHLQCMIGATKGIGFGLGNLLQHVAEPVDVLVRVGLDTWNGRRQAQVFVEDVRKSLQYSTGKSSLELQKEIAR